MKNLAFTGPATLLTAWLIWLTLPLLLPFIVLALALPLVTVGAWVSILACLSLYRQWRKREFTDLPIGEQVVHNPVSPINIMQPSMFATDTPMPKVDYTAAYETELYNFAVVGNLKGFGSTKLIPTYVKRAGWDYYTARLVEAGALVNDNGFRWAPGYGEGHPLPYLKIQIRLGQITFPPPYPNDPPYPVLRVIPLHSNMGSATRHTTQVINMEAA